MTAPTTHNLRRMPMLALLVSLAGLLLTHGIVIACLIYCAFIHPADELVCHHHHGPGAAHPGALAAAAQWQPAGAPSPVLEQGSELPLAVAALLGALIVVRARRRDAATPVIRWASWITPLSAPPPRMTGGRWPVIGGRWPELPTSDIQHPTSRFPIPES